MCGTTLANYLTPNNQLIITHGMEWMTLLFSGELQWRLEYCPCVGGMHNHAYLMYAYLTDIDTGDGNWTLMIIPAGTRVAYIPAGGQGEGCEGGGGGGGGGGGEPEPRPESNPPIASFTFSPETPLARGVVEFDASDSNDSDGTIESFAWDFGDWNWGEGRIVEHTYAKGGRYVVSLTVIDNSGSADTTRLTIEVVAPLHVLCVGMDYGRTLNGREDAEAVYKKLKKFPNWASTNPGPLVLNPTSPNKSTVRGALEAIRSNLDAGDDFIFYFSGHGVFPWSPDDSPEVQRSGDETLLWVSPIWLMDHGVPYPQLEPIADLWYFYFFNSQDEYLKIHDGGGWANNLSDDTLTSWLNDPKWEAVNKFIFLDACHSGGFWGDHNSRDYGDLEKLPSCALMAAAPEGRDATSDENTGRGLWTMALEHAIVFAKTPSEIARYIWYWGGTTIYLNRTVFVREDGPSPEAATVTFEPSLWKPVFYATEDFNLRIPRLTFFEHTLSIENVVGRLQTDPNSPHLNQGLLTYTEETGNIEGLDPNDVIYAPLETTSSKIVSLVPRRNVRGEITGYDELSKDARPLQSSPDSRNDDVMFQLSIYAPDTNQQNLSSENHLEFSLANNAFKGRPVTVQQVSSDLSVTYPVWDVNEIVNKKGGILPLSDLVNQKPNMPYASFTLSMNRYVPDIDGDGLIDLDDYSLLLTDLGKTGILRSDIAGAEGLGLPDGHVNTADETAFIAEYDKRHPQSPIPDPKAALAGDFEGGGIAAPFRTSGDAPWTVTSTDVYSGDHCARSGVIGNGESSSLEITANCRIGKISFCRKVSSEEGHDYLIFYIDGVEKDRWSGEDGWQLCNYTTTPGVHSIRFVYTKDAASSSGQDAAWLDDLAFPSKPTSY